MVKKLSMLLLSLCLCFCLFACQSRNKNQPLNLSIPEIIELIDNSADMSWTIDTTEAPESLDNEKKNSLKSVLSEIEFSPLSDTSLIQDKECKLYIYLFNHDEKVDISFYENDNSILVGTSSHKVDPAANEVTVMLYTENVYEITTDDFQKILDVFG